MTGFNANGIKRRARDAARAGLYKAGRLVAAESLKKVPRDTGELARSIYIKTGRNGLTLEVGYSAEYAAAVHENGREKFLAQPFCALKENIMDILKICVEEALR